jgi:hypothetical protein
MHVRAGHVLLRFRGVDLSREQVMAYSGDAFNLCHASHFQGTAYLGAPHDPMRALADATGFDYEALTDGYTGPLVHGRKRGQRAERTKASLAKIAAEIEAGRPVLVGGAEEHCGTWTLAVGYDQAGPSVCHVGTGIDRKAPAQRWVKIRGVAPDGVQPEFGVMDGRVRGVLRPGLLGGWQANAAYLFKNRRATAPTDADRAMSTLRLAVRLHKAKPLSRRNWGGVTYYFGAEAYEKWAKELATLNEERARPRPKDAYDWYEMGNVDMQVDQIVNGRTAAAAFCERAAGALPAAADHLRAAAEHYRKEVAVARKTFVAFIPRFNGDDERRAAYLGDPDRCREGAAAIRRMLEHERTAVAAIEKALAGAHEAGGPTGKDKAMAANVKRENGKVWIDGVKGFDAGEYASSVHGSQARILEALGESMTYDDLICYGGFAFRVGVHDEFCPSAGHPCCGYMCVDGSNRALPWRVKRHNSFPWDMKKKSAEEVEAIKAEVRAAVKASIDRGVPVHYQAEEDGVIMGYADGGKRWLCMHPYYRGGGEQFWYDEAKGFAGGKNAWPWVVQVFEEPKPADKRVSDRDLSVAALKQAVDMWKSDKKHEDHYFCGDAAYGFWIGRLRDVDAGKAKEPKKLMQGNGWCFDVLVHSRRIAGKWLKAKAADFDGEAGRHLAAAADHYVAIAEECMKGLKCPWDLAPPPGKGGEWTSEKRQEQIKRLEAARKHDAAAVAAIEKALAAVGE